MLEPTYGRTHRWLRWGECLHAEVAFAHVQTVPQCASGLDTNTGFALLGVADQQVLLQTAWCLLLAMSTTCLTGGCCK